MSIACPAIIVLAAGKGTRMQSDLPKVLHELAGKPMLRHVLDTARALDPQQIIIVAGPDMPGIAAIAAPWPVVIQAEQLGTGNAVAAAQAVLADPPSDVLVIYGDTPLITEATYRAMLKARQERNAAVVVLGMRVAPPNAYGRLVLDSDGDLAAIVEAAEAGPEILALDLCNSGVMAIDGRLIWDLIARIDNQNAKGEYYLTDLVALARGDGKRACVVLAPAEELAGVNSRADQAVAEALLQNRLRQRAMAGGATLVDPASIFLSADTVIGRDVVIAPHVVIGPGVVIGDGVEIKAFSHLEGAVIASGAIIGPFARLRPGAAIGAGAHIGNFVEIKNSAIGTGAKVNHLTYLGDAEIGARSNIGAGTITCNYDGVQKYRTMIGADVFIGTHTALVAPVAIGDGAMTAAGSVITRDVAADALAVARAPQQDKPGFAARFRAAKRRDKLAAANPPDPGKTTELPDPGKTKEA